MRRSLLTAFSALAIAAGCLTSFTGCEQKGPAENAGESLDKAGQNLKDAVNPPSGPGEKVGREVDRATK